MLSPCEGGQTGLVTENKCFNNISDDLQKTVAALGKRPILGLINQNGRDTR